MFSKRRLFMLKLTAMTATCMLGACLLAPLSLLAEQHGGNWEAVFKDADKDHDGTLDKNEAKAMPRVSKHFDEIDADKDGTISMDEMKASMEHMRKAMHEKGKAAFKEADKDNDGTLDKEEAKAMPRVSKNFDAIDTDKDGTVSPDEIRAFMKSRQQGGGHQKGATSQ